MKIERSNGLMLWRKQDEMYLYVAVLRLRGRGRSVCSTEDQQTEGRDATSKPRTTGRRWADLDLEWTTTSRDSRLRHQTDASDGRV